MIERIDKGVVTAHFISHWGVPREVRAREARGLGDIVILEFAPKGERTTWRYATNGMSGLPQRDSAGLPITRTEIYACSTLRVAWIDDLLVAIAAYPIDHGTYLAEYDTIDVGRPIDRDRSRFTVVMLAPPGLCDLKTLGLVGGISDDVLVHQIIGISPTEAEFAEARGGASLWGKLGKNDSMLDRNRLPVV